jgi:hypothetical protein
MRSHLKVKVFTLSSEMTYIRRQEEKWKTKARINRQKLAKITTIGPDRDKTNQRVIYCESNFWSQYWHRLDLKYQARHAHLAYGCIKGVPYSKMENICYGPMKGYGGYEPKWEDVSSMVERFAKDEPNQQEINQRAAEWITDAKAWYSGNKDRIILMWHLQEVKRDSEEWKANWAAAKEKANMWRESMGYPTK